MKHHIQKTAAAILIVLTTTVATLEAAEQCNIYTANSCLGIDWTKVTTSQIKSLKLDIRDTNGRTPLHWASARSNNPEVIKTLIELGANVHAEDYMGYTPLHTAVDKKNSSKKIVVELLKFGAKINATYEEGMIGTPLHLAVISNGPELIQVLLKAGANPNTGDFDNMTSLHTAAFANKNPEVLKLLIKAGADVNSRAKVSKRAQQAGYTPLHAAAKGTRNPEIIELLVKAGADIEVRNRDGYTPLHIAADANRTPEVLKMLIKLGAKVNAKSKEGYTPLMVAAFTNYPEMIETLIEAGAKVNEKAPDGITALHSAAIGNADPAVIAELIKSGAETQLKDVEGNTAFDYAKDNEQLKSTDGDGYRMLEISEYMLNKN